MPKRPYTVLCKDTDPNWLELRRTGIGASDIATVLGLNPGGSAYALYLELTGDVEHEDLSGNEFVEWGKRLEPVLIQAYAEKSGRLAWRSGELLRSIKYPWALCTLDGRTAEKDHPRRRWPLEAKAANEWKKEDWAEGPPEHYRVQVHQQMLVTGTDVVSVAVLLGGHKFAWCDVERDETLIERIIEEGAAFYDRVQRRDPPPIDASEACSSAIARRYRIPTPGLVARLPYDYVGIADKLLALKADESITRQKIKLLENQLKAAFGGAETAVLPNGITYTWRNEPRAGYSVEPTAARVLRRQEPRQDSNQ